MRWLTWRFLDGWRDVGLLVIRVGLGLSMIGHGWGKLVGGPERWEKLGGAMSHLGVSFAPTFWGFCAASAEVFGGALLALGLAARPAAAALAFTMFVAWWMHVSKGDPFQSYSHSMEAGLVMLGLVLMGPGRYAVDPHLKGG